MISTVPVMEDESILSPSSSFCCTAPFTSLPPTRVPAVDTIFGYDSTLLRENDTVLDIPQSLGLSTATAKDRPSDKVSEEDEGMHGCCEIKSKASTCSLCGIIWNPLLTSRLALTGLLAILLILMTVLTWVFTSTNVQYSVQAVAARFRRELLLRTEFLVASLLEGIRVSSVSLATVLGSGKFSSFAELQDQVGPALFLVFSVLSKKAGVSFFGQDGMFLSYGADSSGMFCVYANESYLYPDSSLYKISQVKAHPWYHGENISLTRPWYKWYRQNVDERSGLPTSGSTIPLTPIPYWDLEPVKSSLMGQHLAASWGFSLVGSKELSFSFLSPVQHSHSTPPIGTVSVGVPLGNILDELDIEGGAAFVATVNGQLVAQTGGGIPMPSNAHQSLPLAIESKNVLVAAAAEFSMPFMRYILAVQNETFKTAEIEVQGNRYLVNMAPLHLEGATLVCCIIIPYESIWGLTEKRNHTTLVVLVALATCMGLVGCFFIVVLTKGISNEMRLRAALIQQLEETKKAEKKSSHKSLVFANMSHDLRTPLAAILGLIDLSLPDASERSELESNLLQMKSCATNLLGILNTILDMSKIEAGKLVLQESNFDLVNALEEVVDTFSVVGLKKGVEVALDLADGSVEKGSWVVGDVGRVKQIMANLLSNGVKFTNEGHVVLRALVKPLDTPTARPRVTYRGRFLSWPLNQLLRSPSREKELRKLIEGLLRKDENGEYVQIEFEVDDTGRGIPKERWKSVFENFVQVESSGPRSYDGTGLGLGIVRSLVQLMGGDIRIIDKDEPGEPGTRFHFNLVFKRGKQASKNGTGSAQQAQHISLQEMGSLQTTFGVSSMAVPAGWHLDYNRESLFARGSEGTGLNTPIVESVHVLLVMQGQAGKRIVKKWMERRGLQVWTIGNWDEFFSVVQIIKQEIFSESFSMSERFDLISPEGHLHEAWADEWAATGLSRARFSTDASLQRASTRDSRSAAHLHSAQKLLLYGAQARLLLVVDVTMVTVSLDTVCSDLEDTLLNADQSVIFKVVWLVNANTPSSDIKYLRRRTSVCHLVLQKPLYASRLQHVWCLLQELAGNKVQESCEGEAPHMPSRSREKIDLGTANSLYTSLSCMNTFQQERNPPSSLMVEMNTKAHQAETAGSSFAFDRGTLRTHADQQQHNLKRRVQDNRLPVGLSPLPREEQLPVHITSQHVSSASDRTGLVSRDHQSALSAMHVLVAEDNPILQRLTKTHLIRLGATVVCVDNGAEAARLVLENLYKNKVSSPTTGDGCLAYEENETKKNQPFDLVLMDCEMPILNGYEATQRIRSEESRYGVRTPVIALTAHAMAQDEKKCIEAGMDFYLTKPLAVEALLNVVTKITSTRGT